MIKIRNYQEKDRERVERVCVKTAPGPLSGGMMKRVLLTVFCHYYIEQEPQHCFVAVNEYYESVGYVLCAADFMTWEEKFTELYMKKSNNPVTKMLGKGTIDGLRPFAGQYPAHLHIDIDEKYQRQGLGTKLIDALRAHLAEMNVPGLMLSVGGDNENGQKFYQKYGFTALEKKKQEIVMGMKLAEMAR